MKKRLVVEILRELGEAKFADLQIYIEEKLEEKPELELLRGCDLHSLLQEMVEEGKIEKIVPEWGAPLYRVKN